MSKSCHDMLVAVATFPKDKDYETFFKKLVIEKLVACVNLNENMKSYYLFDGKFHCDEEAIAILKLARKNKQKVQEYFCKNHPYKIFELIFFDTKDAYEPYVKFVLEG